MTKKPKSLREEAGMEPCWLVWEAATDDGRPYLVAVDTSEEQADAHVRAVRERARVLDKPPPMVRVEQSWLDHLYGESMTKSFDEIKVKMKEFLRAQVAELRTHLRRAIELAREAASRGWEGAHKRARLDELTELERTLPDA